ncbi:hypothetical protein MRX96_044572 [Rhipicephalus microplus]
MKGVKKTLQLLSKNSKTGAVKCPTCDVSFCPPCRTSHLAELRFREQYAAVQAWNQDYWVKHNAEFQRKKEEFTRCKLAEYRTQGSPRDSVPIEDMASFYKTFLNDNHQKHMQYNWAWYRKNIGLLLPALLASWAYFYREVFPSVVGRTK